MNEQELYDIYFDGNIMEGIDPSEVKRRLSVLFKVDAPVIEKLFREAPISIKKGLNREQAIQYKQAFQQTGALCRAVVATPQATSATAAPNSTDSPPPPPASSSGTLYEPGNSSLSPNSPNSLISPVSPGPGGLYHLDKNAWTSLGIGAALTAVVMLFPFLSFVFRYVTTLVHEIGHAIFGWLFGYPSVPAFDFRYGGGVTMHQDRKIIIVIVVYLLFALLLYIYRRNGLSLIVITALVALYSLSAFTGMHQLIILFMGHGTELIFGSIFFYRALSGSAIVVAAERPLYAFLGFFMYFIDIRFAHRLMTSSTFRADYGDAKGGGHWMDFSRISIDFLHVRLESVAAFFLLFCLLAPFLTFLFFRYRDRLLDIFHRVLTPNPT